MVIISFNKIEYSFSAATEPINNIDSVYIKLLHRRSICYLEKKENEYN